MYLSVYIVRLQLALLNIAAGSNGIIDTYVRRLDENLPAGVMNSPVLWLAIAIDLAIKILFVVLLVLGVRYLWQKTGQQKEQKH